MHHKVEITVNADTEYRGADPYQLIIKFDGYQIERVSIKDLA